MRCSAISLLLYGNKQIPRGNGRSREGGGLSIKAFSVTAQGTQRPANNGQPQWTPAYSGPHLAAGVRVPGLDTVVQGIGGCHTFYLHAPLLVFFITPQRLALKWVLKVRAAPPHASVGACVPQSHHVNEMKRPEQ